MSQMIEFKRIVPGAEVFFGESVAQYLADIADDSFYDESSSCGYLLGSVHSDSFGQYVLITGVSKDFQTDAVGWFVTSENGCSLTDAHLDCLCCEFGTGRVYAIVLDASQGAMAVYAVENGKAEKTRSVMVENL